MSSLELSKRRQPSLYQPVYDFLFVIIELFSLALTLKALQGKTCYWLLSGEGRPWEIFFGFYKTRHILLSDSANCTVLRTVVLTQYRRVTDGRTDGQTDGIVVASTAFATRRAVKINLHKIIKLIALTAT